MNDTVIEKVEDVKSDTATVDNTVLKDVTSASDTMSKKNNSVPYSALSESLITIFSESSPCGEDPKYNNEFEVVKNEIAKPGARDFELIAQNCNTILTSQAKDITTFAYYTLAAAMNTGTEDFCSVIIAFSKVLSDQWESVHPLRERARKNSLSWLNEERTIGLLEKLKVDSSHYELLNTTKQALESIKELTFEKYPDSPPSIKGIIQLVDGWIKTSKPAEVNTNTVKEANNNAGTSSNTDNSATTANVGNTGVMQDVGSKSDAQKNIQKIALYYLKTEKSNPVGYKLLRMVKWQELQTEPKVEGGKTLFAPPIAQRVSYYQNLVQQQNWDGVLEKAETVFTEPGLHFWFDLQQYVCQALTAKGGAYTLCADVIKNELVSLLSRVPSLKDLKYKDDTPFASTQTKEWLHDIVSEQGSGDGLSLQVSSVKSQDLSEDMEQSEALLAKGKFEDALYLIHSGCAYGSLKEICERKIVMARMCYQNNQLFIAESLLVELDEQIISKKLYEWDTEFCSEIWALYIKVLSAILESSIIDEKDKELFKTKLRVTYKRLSNSNPLSATKLSFI